MPILEQICKEKKRLYSVEDIAGLLLNPTMKLSKFVANKVPTMISSSVSFVVSLEAKEDILSWVWGGTTELTRFHLIYYFMIHLSRKSNKAHQIQIYQGGIESITHI